ncbi:putative kelch repeat [Paratrimastix pyriformis]|uniref:Kelch repeat n=1 Tax=Paratrimastix pyriformis TaxID=342808 RepID=A0ABQ8UE86_9EUKA|nr:putative kelch repeat [Paratrimastix pyriformis]
MTTAWRQFSLKGTAPVRNSHSAAQYQNAMYIYGGSGTSTGDVLSLPLGPEVPFSQEREWKNLGTPFTDRYGHSSVVFGTSMYCFGGKKMAAISGGTRCNELIAYDFESKTWRDIPLAGDYPSPRSGHSAVVWHDQMYVFGGVARDDKSQEYFNDCYVFDFGSPPSARAMHSAVVWAGKMWVFAGLDSNERLADMHALDLGQQPATITPAPPPVPAPT